MSCIPLAIPSNIVSKLSGFFCIIASTESKNAVISSVSTVSLAFVLTAANKSSSLLNASVKAFAMKFSLMAFPFADSLTNVSEPSSTELVSPDSKTSLISLILFVNMETSEYPFSFKYS